MPLIRFKRTTKVYIFIAVLTCGTIAYFITLDTLTSSGRFRGSLESTSDTESILKNEYVSSLEEENSEIKNEFDTNRRKGLIIVAHGKSGSSFTLNVFNYNELIFGAYEPLVLTKWWEKADKTGTFNQTEAVLDIISAFMTCSFSKYEHGVHFLDHYSTQWDRRLVSNVFNSPPFCDQRRDRNTCKDLDPKLVDEECMKRKYSVIKVMYNRLPNRRIDIFQSAIKRLKDEMDVKVIHLVRDPRGVINSRINLGWIKDYPSTNFEPKTREVCDLVLNNLIIGEQLSDEMKKNYMLIRYEEISENAVETAKKMYNFAEMKITQSLVNWLRQNVRPKRGEKWTNEATNERTAMVEKICRPLLTWLNIEPSVLQRKF